LSFVERCLLIFLSLLLRFTVRRRNQTPDPISANDRTSLPSLNLSECGDTSHFGGFLQSDDALPKNYVATTAYLHSRQNCNLVTRMMLSYIELGGLSRNVADITFVLAGELENELPERALCTSRTVCASLSRLPMSCVSISDNTGTLEVDTFLPDTEDKGIASLMLKMFVTDPFVAAFESIILSLVGAKRAPRHVSPNQMLIPNVTHSLCRMEQNSVDVSSLDSFQRAINQLVSILEGISFPATTKAQDVTKGRGDFRLNEFNVSSKVKEVDQKTVLNAIDRSDVIRFFIASNCNIKTASMRLVETAIWRSSTFPIDVRTCRIELQTGQFFHQGFDLRGNPVFYFRNYCLGPWRKDPDALIAAVLHRLESSISQLARTNPFVQCTLIVLAGRPHRSKGKSKKELDSPNSSSSRKNDAKDDRHDQSTIASTAVSTLPGTEAEQQSHDGATVVIEHDDVSREATHSPNSNPRVFSDELWNMHTSKETIAKLIKVLLTHYPERLGTALVVIGHGNKKYARSVVSSMIYLAGLIASSRTRDKVRFLTRYRDLQSFVHRSQLITLAGGAQVVDSRHFECR
jgi:CRAL/TRIO domain